MKRAAQLYEKSAAQKHSGAQSNLALCYLLGSGVKLDKKKALHYFKQSSDQGFAEAQYNLGHMYYNGDGVEHDLGEAMR